MDLSKVEPIVGTWTSFIGDLFYNNDIQEFSRELNIATCLPLEKIHGSRDYFKVFRLTDFYNLRAVYIKDLNDSPYQQLAEIEEDIFDGLNVGLMAEENLEWLYDQGILILPRFFTWGSQEYLHKKWSLFTNEVIKRIANTNVLICTSDQEVVKIILDENKDANLIGQGPSCWKKIDNEIRNTFEKNIVWEPYKYY